MFQAWQAERFARETRLKPMAKYLGELKPQRAQTPKEMLAGLKDLQNRGAPMNIRKRQ